MRNFDGRDGARVAYETIGAGTPLLAIHGAYSTHHEIRAVFEPILDGRAIRRIYPDLPGMGSSPAHPSTRTAAGVVDLLVELVDAELGDEPLLLAGHSFGGHIARGLAARLPGRVRGIALLCPTVPGDDPADAHVVVTGGIDPTPLLGPDLADQFAGYFVVHTTATVDRFRDAVVPALGRYDADHVHAMMTQHTLDPDPDATTSDRPALVLTGRHDSLVGHHAQLALIDRYPRGTHAIVADAGHALPHEHPVLVGRHVTTWLASCGLT